MDCLFNKSIPTSTKNRIIIRPSSKTWINGLSQSYDDTYPAELEGLMERDEFHIAMNEINATLYDYWPCFLCFNFGYGCCLCTIGLSFCPSLFCIGDAREQAEATIRKINGQFIKKNVYWELKTKCSTSWIQISKKNKEVQVITNTV